MPISFQVKDLTYKLKEQTVVKKWIAEVCKREKKKLGGINFIFMSDAALLEYNLQYLKHDTFTDIITFDYSENNTVSGDIMISIERVKENSEKFKSGFDSELKRVIIHGVLHLCGYTDKSKKKSEEMRNKENDALKLLAN